MAGNAEQEDEETLEVDDRINIHINNRNHLRELGKILAPVDGFVLTGAFGLLYFILNSSRDKIPLDLRVVELLLITSVILTGSIVSSIQSVTAKAQRPFETKNEYNEDLYEIYAEEHDWAVLSVRLLILGIVAFIFAMVLFSMDYLPHLDP